MKRTAITLIFALISLTAGAQESNSPTPDSTKTKERTIALYGHVKNSLTRVGIPDVLITLMREDSTFVDSMHVYKQWSGQGKDDYAYRFEIPAREQQYIIRAEHPDYETTYVNYTVRHIARNDYFDAPWHYMKKKASLNPSIMGEMADSLKEVVIKATKIKMTYRGDTITFNADAFNLPEGSMLDALIRQMDGVELKDDGRIFVQGEQVEELMLNGKDFFKGNNKVMLDNLPAYTVKQVQTYHKSTELSEYLGQDFEKKRFVMDVQLKREYNQGWIANVEAAGGWKDKSEGKVRELSSDVQVPYIGRFFALRYTNNSRLSIYGNTNNVNESRRPGGNGEWEPSNAPRGLHKHYMAGMNLFIEEKDKRWKENLTLDAIWRHTTDQTLNSAEQFHTNTASTFSRQTYYHHNNDFSLSATNLFQLNKPFFLFSSSFFKYNLYDNNSNTRSAQFSSDPSRYGNTTAILDSVFSATLSTSMQQTLINSNLQRANGEGNNLTAETTNYLTKKLASGDNAGVDFSASYNRGHSHSNSEQQLRYQLTPTLNSILNRRSSTPSSEKNVFVAPNYRITWLNGMYLYAEYRFLYRERDNTNDVFLADTLDLQNAYDRNHRRLENRVALTPGYSYNKNGKYARVYYQMHFYNVNERLKYQSAYTDTTLIQHCWTMSPELHVQYAWDDWSRSFDYFYGIEFQTPDLFQRVNILNDENPLIRRYGNPDLRGATNHRMQFGINRNWREKRISERFGGGLRFFRHQVSQGQTYDSVTGIYTYRPENVEGNWQTYFFNFYNMPLDKPRRLMMNIYTHGDYSRNVDILNGLSHVNNYFLENRLTFSYTWRDLTLGLPTNIEYRHTTNEEHTIETINAFNYYYGITLNYNFKREEASKAPRWLQGFSFATDLKMYSRRGYGDTSMNRDDLVWNASISRSFPNPFGKRAGGTLVARLEGFDILGQLSSTQLFINGQGRQETIYNTLPRYLMLHLTYNWNKTPKKAANR